jgi:enoyl-CoA hydratase/carnithine racemase
MKENLFVEIKNSIATMYINRPEKKNALTYEMWSRIPDILQDLENNEDVKLLIIRGIDETAFAAGADVNEFSTLRSTAVGESLYNQTVTRAESALANFSKPTISMIQKYCIGGGCILALATDLRFASESSMFAITPSKLGMVYPFSSTKKLVDLIGPARAKDILFSGRELNVYEAYSFRLVDRIYADEEIATKTYDYAEMLVKRSQKTVKSAKKIIDHIKNGMDEETEEIRELVDSSYLSSDYKEGVKAFLEKRAPKFSEL